MDRMVHINEIPSDFSDDPNFETALKTMFAGDFLGSEKLYINIDYVKPGAKSCKYHSHSLQEEFFMILSGEGVLRFNEEYVPVGKGDMVSKPAGKMYTHQFLNTGEDLLTILDVGTREKGDLAYYPDEDTVMFRDDRRAFRKECMTDKWSSDPNLE